MQKISLKQEENVLVLVCLGAEPSWKWFGLESTFSFFLSPAECWPGTCGYMHFLLPNNLCTRHLNGMRDSGCLGAFEGWLLPQGTCRDAAWGRALWQPD